MSFAENDRVQYNNTGNPNMMGLKGKVTFVNPDHGNVHIKWDSRDGDPYSYTRNWAKKYINNLAQERIKRGQRWQCHTSICGRHSRAVLVITKTSGNIYFHVEGAPLTLWTCSKQTLRNNATLLDTPEEAEEIEAECFKPGAIILCDDPAKLIIKPMSKENTEMKSRIAKIYYYGDQRIDDMSSDDIIHEIANIEASLETLQNIQSNSKVVKRKIKLLKKDLVKFIKLTD